MNYENVRRKVLLRKSKQRFPNLSAIGNQEEIIHMKRIGIVTFFSNCNYGSVLQAYALSQYLIQKGYDVEIIDYLNTNNLFNIKMKIRTISNRLGVLLTHPSMWRTALKSKSTAKRSVTTLPYETISNYKDFIENNLKPYRGKYHRNSDFDAFICGSDQIWQISAPGLNNIFFLRFTMPQKRIAYAASLGSITVPKYNAKRFEKYINGFSAISVRECASKQLIKDFCNQESAHVIDPTLLIGKAFWSSITTKYEKQDKYILCYFLDKCTGVENIINLAKSNDLHVFWIETGTEKPNGSKQISPSPFEFVSLMQNADYVFTDSFHACCFSSLFERSFYVVRRNYQGYPAQHIRIEELLTTLKLNERHIDTCLEVQQLEPISAERYNVADNKLSELRKVSVHFLESALKNI